MFYFANESPAERERYGPATKINLIQLDHREVNYVFEPYDGQKIEFQHSEQETKVEPIYDIGRT